MRPFRQYRTIYMESIERLILFMLISNRVFLLVVCMRRSPCRESFIRSLELVFLRVGTGEFIVIMHGWLGVLCVLCHSETRGVLFSVIIASLFLVTI